MVAEFPFEIRTTPGASLSSAASGAAAVSSSPIARLRDHANRTQIMGEPSLANSRSADSRGGNVFRDSNPVKRLPRRLGRNDVLSFKPQTVSLRVSMDRIAPLGCVPVGDVPVHFAWSPISVGSHANRFLIHPGRLCGG